MDPIPDRRLKNTPLIYTAPPVDFPDNSENLEWIYNKYVSRMQPATRRIINPERFMRHKRKTYKSHTFKNIQQVIANLREQDREIAEWNKKPIYNANNQIKIPVNTLTSDVNKHRLNNNYNNLVVGAGHTSNRGTPRPKKKKKKRSDESSLKDKTPPPLPPLPDEPSSLKKKKEQILPLENSASSSSLVSEALRPESSEQASEQVSEPSSSAVPVSDSDPQSVLQGAGDCIVPPILDWAETFFKHG